MEVPSAVKQVLVWVLVLLAPLRMRGIASRDNEVFIPRKMEFEGWFTDYTRSSFQRITNEEVMVMIVDLEKMLPSQFHQYIDWDHSRKEPGNWTTKTIVNMWFNNETTLATMIGLLKVVKADLKNVSYKIRDQEVTARLEVSPPKKPLAKAHALFYRGLKAVKGDLSQITVVHGKLQISFFVGGHIYSGGRRLRG